MPYIILDRDGVINFDSDQYIKSPEEWLPIPGSLQAIAQLNQAGFEIFIATNQSGVGRGYYSLNTLTRIHQKLREQLATVGGYIKEIFYCPHHPEENCACRKPRPGLLQQIKIKYKIDLKSTFFIGDSHIDIQAAQTIGCRPILVLTGKGQEALNQYPELIELPHFANLAQAAPYVISHYSKIRTLS
jgi:D-glycero-D-manno-heptose 1,7-bisphosphate phosphatase